MLASEMMLWLLSFVSIPRGLHCIGPLDSASVRAQVRAAVEEVGGVGAPTVTVGGAVALLVRVKVSTGLGLGLGWGFGFGLG